ncbi:potassium channel subfamily K member 17 [Culicoides brevitarsis]|uniref:potassium channel subfamily K member 17 n=1 Tax=Culicoides brevitarsis TaxID=469753 RepID=UPI00307B753B
MMERKRSFKRRKQPLSERAKEHCRKLTAFLFSNVGIILLVVLYTIAGSFMFIAIEGQQAIERWQNITRQRVYVASKLWEISCCEENTFNKSRFTSLVRKEIYQYQESIVRAARKGWQGIDTGTGGESNSPWSFSGAFLYSLTVITTIGYGNISPRTELGKISTIFYAIIGMPLFLLYLSLIGDILAKSFKWTYAKFCLCRICPGVARKRAIRERSKKNSTEEPENNYSISDIDFNENDLYNNEIENEITGDTHTVTVPLTVCIAIMIGYIIFGASLFARWENWNLLDGSYFCFISLSSIGFGDIVPGLSLKNPEDKERLVDVSFILCAVYLLLGMALIAMCFSLMQEQVVYKLRSFKACVKGCFRCRR